MLASLVKHVNTLLRYYGVGRMWPWFTLYTIALLAVMPREFSGFHRGAFLAYGLFVFFILREYITKKPTTDTALDNTHWRPWLIAVLVFALAFFVASRLYLFIRYGEAPLGYDTGFYWQYFHLIIPAGKIGHAIGTNHLAYAPWFPLGFLGFSALQTIHILHVFHQMLTLGAFYFLLRSLPAGNRTPVWVTGLFLFTISINQFMAFDWMFYKQSMAMPFLLLALGLFLRGSWLAFPLAIFGAAIHLYPTIPFAIAFALFLVIQVIKSRMSKQPLERSVRYLALGGIAAFILLLLLKGPSDIKDHANYFLRFNGLATSGPSWGISQAKGLFLPFATFRLNALFYLPFTIIGVLVSYHSQLFPGRLQTLPILFTVSLILGIFPFLYQNRSLILLDVFMILMAAYPLTLFMKRILGTISGRLVVGTLFIGSVLFTSRVIWHIEPQLYSDEARELSRLRIGAPNFLRSVGDYVMATSSLYTPWVYAYADFESTIAPGYLTWDRWNLDMWQEFWSGRSDARRIELLAVYGTRHPIFMFFGNHQTVDPRLKRFFSHDPHITPVSPHFLKYTPQISSPPRQRR